MIRQKNNKPVRSRWPLVAAVVALSLNTASALADADADGIADAVDNCVEVANPLQRDTDRDGYGNFCDPDFNNDRIVNATDLGVLRQAFFSTAQEQDLNGDGHVNAGDLGIMKRYFFGSPGPGAPDTDGDGVTLDSDRCPDSAPGGVVVEAGCTAFDIVQDPRGLDDSGPVREAVVTALTQHPELAFVLDGVLDAVSIIDENVARIGRVQACDAMDGYWEGYAKLDRAALNLRGFVDEFESALAANPPFTQFDCGNGQPQPCEFDADHTEDDLLLVQYQDAAAQLGDLQQRYEHHGGRLSNTCTAISQQLSRPGHVIDVDDANRQIRMLSFDGSGEFTVALSDDIVVGTSSSSLQIYPGRQLRALGVAYGPAAGVAGSLTPVGGERPPASLFYSSCGILRIAPYQRFAPISSGPFLLHNPDAYLYESGRLHLEKGMRFAMINAVGCVDSDADNFVSYSASLLLNFRNRDTGLQENRALALNLTAGSQPVALPDEIEEGSFATLTVNYKRQSCPQPNNQPIGQVCSQQEIYETEVYEISVREKESYCNAIYDETQFELEYVGPTTFRSAHISDRQTLLVVPDAGTQMSIVAEGYAVNGGVSTYPSLTQINEGDQFAIYTHDCTTQSGLLYQQGSCGTNKASGLRWPRLTGVRNGHAFSYSCSLPEIIRDLRDYCPQAPNALYKLPFRGSSPTWQIWQGNNGDFTHNGNQSFAFDFGADQGTIIRAARSGVVAFVREDQTGNSYYDPDCTNCMANRVTIRHQDGTLTDYLHLRTNGAYVDQNEVVQRGQAIGEVGNIGFSTDPHLHFQARRSGNPTHPVRFEALDNGLSGPPSTCWIPQTGDSLASDN